MGTATAQLETWGRKWPGVENLVANGRPIFGLGYVPYRDRFAGAVFAEAMRRAAAALAPKKRYVGLDAIKAELPAVLREFADGMDRGIDLSA